MLVSRLHSTGQTAKQIAITQHKNNMDAFYSHRDKLFAYFDRLDESHYYNSAKVNFKLRNKVHKRFFIGDPNSGIPKINNNWFEITQNRLGYADKSIYLALKNYDSDIVLPYYLQACLELREASRYLEILDVIRQFSATEEEIEIEDKSSGKRRRIDAIGENIEDLLSVYFYINEFFWNLCDFSDCPQYVVTTHRVHNAYKKNKEIPGCEDFVDRLHRIEIPDILRRQKNEVVVIDLPDWKKQAELNHQNTLNLIRGFLD